MTRRPPDDGSPENAKRRSFLQAAGIAVGAVTLPSSLTACNEALVQAPADLAEVTEDELERKRTHWVEVVRPDDLVVLRFSFVNLVVTTEKDGSRVLTKSQPARAAYVVVGLPAQHVFEQAFFKGSGAQPTPSTLASSRLSGPSRLVFDAGDAPIPYTLPGLLGALSTLDLVLSKNAAPPDPVIPFPFPFPFPLPFPFQLAAGGAILPQPLSPVQIAEVARLGRVALRSGPFSRASGPTLPPRALAQLALSDITKIPFPPIFFPPGKPNRPSALETAIELPFRLQLSPVPGAAFAHETGAKKRGLDRVELWHTRLGVRAGAGVQETSTVVRALWTRDPSFKPGLATQPQAALADDHVFAFETLTPFDRARIVEESSDFTLAHRPRPVAVDRLMLSSLGGWLDALGTFSGQTGLLEWEHHATMGRDHYVRTVDDGYLYPFGHRAVLITITERRLDPTTPSRAFLWQRQFIRIQEPQKTYAPGSGGSTRAQAERRNPFLHLEVRTLVTPDLEPMTKGVPAVPTTLGGTAPFFFEMLGNDRDGKLVRFRTPVVWLPADDTGVLASVNLDDVQTTFRALPERTVDLEGQRVSLVASSQDADDGVFETRSITFDGDNLPGGKAPYLPVLEKAALVIDSVRHFAKADAPTQFSYAPAYLTHGLDPIANAGEVVLQLAEGKLEALFSKASGASGGFVAPDFSIQGISRALGPISGGGADPLTKIAGGTFDPNDFFSLLGDSAKIFGVFKLTDILGLAGVDLGLDKAPKWVVDTVGAATAFFADAKRLYDQVDAFATFLMSLGPAASAKAKAVADDLAAVRAKLDAFVNQVQKIADGSVDPQALLADLLASKDLLAALPLRVRQLDELAETVRRETARALDLFNKVLLAGAEAEAALKAALKAFQEAKDLAENLTVKLDWKVPVQSWPASAPIFAPDPGSGLVLGAVLRAKASAGRPAGLDLLCTLEKFELRLIPGLAEFMTLRFGHITFKTETGKKAEVDVKFEGITWKGPLSFINALKEVLPLDGFSDPPSLDVSPSGIEAKFSLALPNVAIGIFSLTNIAIGAGFKVPFIGDPLTVSFNFCTREHPFNLTVSLLGGGGFFGITIGPDSVVLLEAALEFGASLALDFGVASGSVSIMAGIYFKMAGKVVTLAGYLRIRGEVDVIGLITASIELYMELSYESGTGKVIGRATLEIEVSIAFFSTSVTISCERKFAGSNGDPTFRDVMGDYPCPELGDPCPVASPWDEYVHAFAD